MKLLPCCVVKVSCGAHHSLVLDAKGAVYAWGENAHGQLGLGDRKDRSEPTLVAALKRFVIVEVAAGRDFSTVVDSAGRVHCWGRNDIVGASGGCERRANARRRRPWTACCRDRPRTSRARWCRCPAARRTPWRCARRARW